MERKFESELGKRIVEGDRRVPAKKVGLVVAAVGVMALLIGAASVSMAMQANAGGPDFIYDAVVWDGYEDLIMSEIDPLDVAAKRVMNLKFKSSAPPGESDGGLFKFTYGVNIQFKELVDGIGTGTAVGNLVIGFAAPVDDGLVSFVAAGTLYGPDGAIIGSGTFAVSDVNADPSVMDVTAAIPIFYTTVIDPVTTLPTQVEVPLVAGCTVSLTVQILIDDSPLLSGTLTEQPWPTLIHDEYGVDENGNPIIIGQAYDYAAYNAVFAVPVQ